MMWLEDDLPFHALVRPELTSGFCLTIPVLGVDPEVVDGINLQRVAGKNRRDKEEGLNTIYIV